MEVALAKPKHRENILMALSVMPIARTDQIARLFQTNGSPLRRASQYLNELEEQKLVEFEWHKRGKIWRLSKRGLSSMGIGRTKFEHVDHTLAIGDIYFTLKPEKFMFEPQTLFSYGGRDDLVFAPDCIFVHNKKLIVAEVQLSNLSEAGWKKKYSIYNKYFESAFKTHEYQSWSTTGKIILPQFLCVSNQGNVCGLNIPQRELQVIKDISQLNTSV